MAKHFFGLTDTGKTRDNNEDSFIVQPINGEQYILAAVIDGVGGYHGGEVAAAIAKEEMMRQFIARPKDPISQIIDAFRETNRLIVAKKETEKELSEMACVATLVLADIENNQFYYGHVGDTRLYLLRDGSLVKISKDHSFVGFLEDSGRLDEVAAMQHPKRNELNKAIGFSDQITNVESYIETGQSPFLPGDTLLLCSDGLTDMVNKQDITSLLMQGDRLAKKADNLIALANENGGRDNITVVLLQNNKAKQNVEPTRPGLAQQVPLSTTATMREEPVTDVQPETNSRSKKHPGFIALIILCIVLLGTTLLLFLKSQQTVDHGSMRAAPAKILVRNNQEKLLQDAIDHAPGDTLVLSDSIFKSPILLSDTLRIRKDTLHIFAHGIVLQADSGYKGAAIILKSQSKLISLDSMQFKGFNLAIAASNQALFLKNVRFINCVLPVNNSYVFPNQQLINMLFPSVNQSKNITKATDSKNGAN
ncbi:serine/threonine-protein phosphatase [Pedobacter frigiditerrae]|uniref:Serine/threonine-protein phosphatase n=1 Tax=Pedobacter frigiditerrae TaxID=2530452 RepID=A0A4R0MV49_9SPHI|nr:protein phosphatase 2C domain-containing protein [Pedobacter frigiditerrae]TCC90072.1 serine/threonine-protein phosphatase [Pedobacter frigiditerrae]